MRIMKLSRRGRQMQNMQQSYSNIPNQGHSRTPNQWNNNVQYPQPQYQQAQQNGHGPRRASDPVRALDRNFGVTPSHNHPQGQLNSRQKTGSFQNIDNSQMNQRLPLHGQRIRGTSGDSHFVNQPMPNNGIINQGMMYNSNTSVNSGNAMTFANSSSSNPQFSQQSGFQHQQQASNPQNNYHATQQHQQHPQLWTDQQQNNYQQPTNNNNGFNSNNTTKGAEINNSNSAFRSSTSNPGNITNPASNLSQQSPSTPFNNQATPTSNPVGQAQNNSTSVNPSWGTNSHPQNMGGGPNWQQPTMNPNWQQQPQNQNQLPSQVQPQQSSLQRTFDYVQQCQNWST